MKHFYYGCFKIPSDHPNICVISGLASAHSLFLFKSRFPWLGWDEFWAACPLHVGYHVLRPWPDGPGGAAIQLHIELLWPGSHRRTALPPPPSGLHFCPSSPGSPLLFGSLLHPRGLPCCCWVGGDQVSTLLRWQQGRAGTSVACPCLDVLHHPA